MMDLKPSGGVYYVPEHQLGTWRRLSEGVEQCQEGNVISTIRAAMDEGTARAVRDALTRQVQEEATKLVDDVSKGTLGADGIRRRAEQAQTLIERVDLYSSILNDGLTGLKNVAALAKQTAMAYVMQDMAGVCAAA
jgi:PleD family two-component response regulator